MATDHLPPEETGADDEAPPARPSWRTRLWRRWRPTLWQAWLNVRAWIPFLANPFERKRLVRYTAREKRRGLVWSVDLPAHCYHCGTGDDLSIRRVSRQVRSFEYPVAIVAGTLAAMLSIALLQLLLGLWLTLLIWAALAALGTAIFFLKSWRERVELVLWTCETDAPAFEPPDVVVHDEELYLYLPSVKLAKAAAAELKNERASSGRLRSGEGPDP
jgi:hypothetical protein